MAHLQLADIGAKRDVALATGEAGTVYLCHPFLIHAAQKHKGAAPRFMSQPPLAPAAQLRVERGAQQRPVLPEQPRVDEPGQVVAAALGQHDPVHAAPEPVVGHVEFPHSWPGEVAGQDDDTPFRPVQIFQPGWQPSGQPDPPRPQ